MDRPWEIFKPSEVMVGCIIRSARDAGETLTRSSAEERAQRAIYELLYSIVVGTMGDSHGEIKVIPLTESSEKMREDVLDMLCMRTGCIGDERQRFSRECARVLTALATNGKFSTQKAHLILHEKRVILALRSLPAQ